MPGGVPDLHRLFVAWVASTAWGWLTPVTTLPQSEQGARATSAPEATISVEHVLNAPPGRYWMQVRAGAIPAGRPGAPHDRPLVVMTMQYHESQGTHMYSGIHSMWSDDLGKTWHGPALQTTLERQSRDNGLIEVPVDASPQWHAATGRLLLTGATFWLDTKLERDIRGGPSDTPYSVYDAHTHHWGAWRTLQMPDDPRFRYSRAGCTQRVDLPNGDVLLPIYFGDHNNSIHYATVTRCRFDGSTLTYQEHGDELVVPFGRGFSEPSLTTSGGEYYLTLRNDQRGYVSRSSDGLHFSTPVPWTFDSGEELGSYNTQQHWVTHSDGLFLAYTRRGAGNDDVFRHRAPLLLAQVDPGRLCVLKDTEQVLLPKLQGGFGNFGVCHITANETWITAGRRAAQPGEPSVYIARIHWSQPNALAGEQPPR